MALAKFEENRFRIDGEIAENHAILVNLTASLAISNMAQHHIALLVRHVALQVRHVALLIFRQ